MKISDYCPWCDFGEETVDDCTCDEQCGEIGCQGLDEIDPREESFEDLDENYPH